MGVLDGYDSGRAAPVNNGGFTRSSSIGGGGGGGGSFGYSSVAQVVNAYTQNKISYREAYNILMTQFGLSDNDINDVLIAEQKPQKPAPGVPDDSEDEEPIPDTSTDTSDSDPQIVGLSDDQRFMLIGLVVVGALLGFIKR
jgi:hypothetical protein|tara:strand:- start:583 stop:1005 length:423 start_codon:yes stop_codon:yes gene_type:complete